MNLNGDESNALHENENFDTLRSHQGMQPGFQSWEVVVFALVGTICFISIVGALVFAVKHHLCGHCVGCVDSLSEMTKACASALKRRYKHIDTEEGRSTLEINDDVTPAQNLIGLASTQNTSKRC